MIHGPLSPIEAVMVAISGFVIVFLMLALLWGVIVVISRVVGAMEKKNDGYSARSARIQIHQSGIKGRNNDEISGYA